jgi:hypothetical protein
VGQKVFDEPALKHQVIDLLRGTTNDRLERHIGIMCPGLRTSALGDLAPQPALLGSSNLAKPIRMSGQKSIRCFLCRVPLERLVLWPGVLPNVVNHVVCRVTREETCKGMLVRAFCHAYRVRDDEGGHFLVNRFDIVEWDDEGRHPAKYVGIETHVVLGDVKSSLNQDIPL